jgi:hypothetical protein
MTWRTSDRECIHSGPEGENPAPRESDGDRRMKKPRHCDHNQPHHSEGAVLLASTLIDRRRIYSPYLPVTSILVCQQYAIMTQQTPGRSLFWFLPRGRPAVTLGIVSLIAMSAVAYSHDAQVREKEVMRAGVERDKERVRRIRREHKALLLKQEQEKADQLKGKKGGWFSS